MPSRERRKGASAQGRNRAPERERAVAPEHQSAEAEETPGAARRAARGWLPFLLAAVALGVIGASLWQLTSDGGDSGYVRELDPTDRLDLTVFVDFNCPHCARWGTTNLPDWQVKVFEPGHATYRQVNYPFLGENSRAAAEAAVCAAEAGVLAQFTAAAFAQKIAGAQEVDVAAAAAASGVPGKIADCVERGSGAKGLNAELGLARDAGVDGTPAYYIDGQRVTGTEALDALRRKQ